MPAPRLTIDLEAIAANWRALDRASATGVQTAAVVKADAYGLGAARVARALAVAGARRFFVAYANEGAMLRSALGPGPQICLLSGHMEGDNDTIAQADLTPMLNSVDQVSRHLESLPAQSFGVQLDTGMNRLGMDEAEWEAAAPYVLEAGPEMLISHLACGDEPDHPMNEVQLARFHAMTDGTGLPRSLSATAGILLGPRYHFDLTRPGIGLYGGAPYEAALPVVGISLPVVQVRTVQAGDSVGYAVSWHAEAPARIATVLGGYADGILRSLSNRAVLFAGNVPCLVVGRISMDAVTVDISHLPEVPDELDLIGPHQGINDLASAAGTIAYEILTRLSARLDRLYHEGTA